MKRNAAYRTIRLVSLVLVLILLAHSAHAEERAARRLILPATALVGGAVFDVVSTRQAFGRGCREGNTTLYGAHPSTGRLVTVKAVTAGAGVAAMWLAHKTGHPRVARVFGYAAGGAATTAGVLNSAHACR